MTVGEGVDSVIESALIGFGGAIKTVAVAAHRVLSLRPARVEADLRAYLAMTALSHEAALVADEAEREVYEPDELWCAQRVREQEDNFGRAQHPLYREIQDAFQSSAPVAHSPEPVVAESPGVAPPKSATPGQPAWKEEWARLLDHLSERVDPAGVGDIPGTGGSQNVEQIVADVLMGHWYRPADHSSIGREAHCGCGGRPIDQRDWQWHVAGLIAQQLTQHNSEGTTHVS